MAVEKTHKEVVWVVGRQVNMADVLEQLEDSVPFDPEPKPHPNLTGGQFSLILSLSLTLTSTLIG